MDKLFLINVVTIRNGEQVPLPGVTVACYIPTVREVIGMTDGRATIPIPACTEIIEGMDMIIRVRKFGYLPVEEVVTYDPSMEELQIIMKPDKVCRVDEILTKVRNSFVGLKDLLI